MIGIVARAKAAVVPASSLVISAKPVPAARVHTARRCSKASSRKLVVLSAAIPRKASVSIVHSAAVAERQVWLPGVAPPAHLDGSMPGDFGFDPFGLAVHPTARKWFQQAELLHARLAMTATSGVLFVELANRLGFAKLPPWYLAGAVPVPWADVRTLFFMQMVLFGFVEIKRYADFTKPHSQGAKGSFFGLEEALAGQSNGYPGGPLFDPLGFATLRTGLPEDLARIKIAGTKELKNGRLAMMAIIGIFVQYLATGVGPLENLDAHLADPWHVNVVSTLKQLLP